jgi:hypothetical protein
LNSSDSNFFKSFINSKKSKKGFSINHQTFDSLVFHLAILFKILRYSSKPDIIFLKSLYFGCSLFDKTTMALAQLIILVILSLKFRCHLI